MPVEPFRTRTQFRDPVIGAPAVQRDQSAEGIGSHQGALGTTEHFHLCHVEQCQRAATAAEVNAIEQNANRGIQGLHKLTSLANTADL